MAFSDPACGNFPKERRQSGNEATFHQHQRSCSVSRRQLFNHLFKLVCCILTDDFSLKAPVLVPSALTFPLTGALHYCQRCRSNVWFKGSFLQPGMKNQSSFLLSPVLIFQVSCLALTRCCFPEPPPSRRWRQTVLAFLTYESLDVLIRYGTFSGASLADTVCFSARGACGESWRLINWINGGIFGTRWVPRMETGNFMCFVLKLPVSDATKPGAVCTKRLQEGKRSSWAPFPPAFPRTLIPRH